MRRPISRCAAVALALPLAVGTQSPDSAKSITTFYLAGGAGDYADVSRGCQGEVLSKEQYAFRDYGAAVDHKFAAPIRVGVRAGGLEERGVINRYANPHVSLEWRKFSLGYGPVFGQRDFSTGSGVLENSRTWHSGHIRIGDRNKLHFSTSYFENLPLYSGGGHFDVGMGGRPAPRLGIWAGLSGEPYDGAGLAIKSEYRVTGGFSAVLKTRLGSSEGVGENAISVGVQYQWAHGKRAQEDRGSAETRETTTPK